MNGGYLKCDAKGCEHKEAVASFDKTLIGKPCPKCGASLLTSEDYEEGKRMKAVIDALYALGLARPATEDDEPTKDRLIVSVNPHAESLHIQVKGGA